MVAWLHVGVGTIQASVDALASSEFGGSARCLSGMNHHVVAEDEGTRIF